MKRIGPIGKLAEEGAGLLVGAAGPQMEADFSGPVAVRNGLAAAAVGAIGGGALAVFGRQGGFLARIGKAVAAGSLSWGAGGGAQHVDQAILNSANKKTSEVQRAQAAVAAAQRAQAQAVRLPAGSGLPTPQGRPVETYQYPEAQDL